MSKVSSEEGAEVKLVPPDSLASEPGLSTNCEYSVIWSLCEPQFPHLYTQSLSSGITTGRLNEMDKNMAWGRHGTLCSCVPTNYTEGRPDKYLHFPVSSLGTVEVSEMIWVPWGPVAFPWTKKAPTLFAAQRWFRSPLITLPCLFPRHLLPLFPQPWDSQPSPLPKYMWSCRTHCQGLTSKEPAHHLRMMVERSVRQCWVPQKTRVWWGTTVSWRLRGGTHRCVSPALSGPGLPHSLFRKVWSLSSSHWIHLFISCSVPWIFNGCASWARQKGSDKLCFNSFYNSERNVDDTWRTKMEIKK